MPHAMHWLTHTMLTPRNWRLLMMCGSGFSSALPLGVLNATVIAWFTVSDWSIASIGWFSLVGNFYLAKMLWSPWVDRCPLPPYWGRYTGWMFWTQWACLLCLLGLSTVADPTQQVQSVVVWCMLLAFFSATQDLAVDANRVHYLPPEERALGATWAIVGVRIALLWTGAAALLIAQTWSWSLAYDCLAASMLIGVFSTLGMRYYSAEPPLEDAPIHRPVSQTPLSLRALFANIWRSYPGWGWCVAIALLYKMDYAWAFSLQTPFLMRGAHYSLMEIAAVGKVCGLWMSIAGGLVGGWYLSRVDLWTGLWRLAWCQSVSILAFLLLLWVPGYSVILLACVLSFEYFVSGMGTAAFAAALMSWCQPGHAAMQYAFWSILASVGRTVSGPITGQIAEHWGWGAYILVAALWALPSLYALYRWRPYFFQKPEGYAG